MILKAVGKYEIVGVIGGYMVYPQGVPVAPVPRPSQIYGGGTRLRRSLSGWRSATPAIRRPDNQPGKQS